MSQAPHKIAHRLLVIDGDPAVHAEVRKLLSGGEPKEWMLTSARPAAASGGVVCPSGYVLDSAYEARKGVEMIRQAHTAGQPYAIVFASGTVLSGWDRSGPSDQLREAEPDVQVILLNGETNHGAERSRSLRPASQALSLNRPLDGPHLIQVTKSLTEKWDLAQQVKTLQAAVAKLRAESAERKQHDDQSRVREMAQRHAEWSRCLGILSGRVAYHLNNTLTGLQMGTCALINRQLSEAQQSKLLNRIAEEAKRVSTFSRQLFDYSNSQPCSPQKLDLNANVANLAPLLKDLLGPHVSLGTDLAAGTLMLQADPGMIEQLLVCFAFNTRAALPKGGQLSLSTCKLALTEKGQVPRRPLPPGNYVRLDVRDNGAGITPERLEHVFDPFSAAEASGTLTGLELAIAHDIVVQLGGCLEVTSTPGTGTTFSIYLPLLPEAAGNGGESKQAHSNSMQKDTILLVEDDAGIREIVRLQLETHGYHVLEAEDSAEALKVWKAGFNSVNLLMTDLVMPGITDGKQLADRLRSEKPSLKVILTTGFGESGLASKLGLDANTRFLPKPYETDGLLQTVRDSLKAN